MTEITNEQMRDKLGNVDRIRDLLFGQNIQEYSDRFEKCEQRLHKLESDFYEFRSEMRDRLHSLQSSLTQEIRANADSLEKKLKYLSLTTHEKTNNLEQEIKFTTQKNSEEIEYHRAYINDEVKRIDNDLSDNINKISSEVRNLKQQVFEELAKSFDNLKENKVSREDLAEVLFELCLKVKGTDFVPSLQEAGEKSIKTDFLLPEENTNNNSK